MFRNAVYVLLGLAFLVTGITAGILTNGTEPVTASIERPMPTATPKKPATPTPCPSPEDPEKPCPTPTPSPTAMP